MKVRVLQSLRVRNLRAGKEGERGSGEIRIKVKKGEGVVCVVDAWKERVLYVGQQARI